MSYRKFTRAVNDFCVYEKANNLPPLKHEESEALVLDT